MSAIAVPDPIEPTPDGASVTNEPAGKELDSSGEQAEPTTQGRLSVVPEPTSDDAGDADSPDRLPETSPAEDESPKPPKVSLVGLVIKFIRDRYATVLDQDGVVWAVATDGPRIARNPAGLCRKLAKASQPGSYQFVI